MARLPRGTAPLTLAALILLAVLGGCGGGGEEVTDTTAVTGAAAPAAQPVVNTGAAAAPRAAYEGLVGTQFTAGDETPADVKDAVEQGRPVVMAFFVAGSHDDGKVRETLDKLAPKYEDILVARYDFNKPDEFGSLSRLLQIDYPPQLVFVDPTGIIRSVLSGFVDEGTLNQHLVNIRQG